ncbi:DUF4345 domain-containing protein [Leptospira fletcheri]|uniref:DUF4345 domain-containing protein n=1 Tax=Leptospira fletcheri TaxID=2484981 RepID=A0A4R9GH54_9LEPT|nr:DUF4345 domain-containing protein [Leptospira fletcheri]TGK12064.1 DUF4345 domain-containing protein [Leptospira fletcheri]
MQTHILESEKAKSGSKYFDFLRSAYLLMNLAVYFGFAVGFLVQPNPLAEMIGISFRSTAALADFRAMYGGLCLGIGILILSGMLRPTARIAAIQLSLLTAAGLFLGRLITIVFDGPGNEYIYISMFTEAVGVFLGWFLLRK